MLPVCTVGSSISRGGVGAVWHDFRSILVRQPHRKCRRMALLRRQEIGPFPLLSHPLIRPSAEQLRPRSSVTSGKDVNIEECVPCLEEVASARGHFRTPTIVLRSFHARLCVAKMAVEGPSCQPPGRRFAQKRPLICGAAAQSVCPACYPALQLGGARRKVINSAAYVSTTER